MMILEMKGLTKTCNTGIKGPTKIDDTGKKGSHKYMYATIDDCIPYRKYITISLYLRS